MSRDGLLWPWVSKVHPKYQTPYLSQAATGAIATTFAFFVKLEALAEMVTTYIIGLTV
jgi:APA family basic amino acid/polyamine antiporter